MRIKMCHAASVAAIACVGVAHAGVVAEFQLSDHPDGNASPPPYGLRLDGLFGGGTTTFSFTDVVLTVSEDMGNLSINISGEVFGGEVSGGAYVGGGDAYDLDFTYAANVEVFGGGWRVTGIDNVSNTGTLALIGGTGDESLFTFTDDNNNAFIFAPDGHRLSGDDSSWVGRGWLTDDDTGAGQSGTQDWLFTGELIPAPGTAALLSVGLLAASRRRR